MLSERLPTNPIVEQPKEKDWGYGQLLAILMRRRFWFVGVFISVLAASVLLTLRAKPIYQSSMRVLVQPNYKSRPQSNGVKTSQMDFSDPQVQVDLTTQLQVLKSSELLQQAVDQLKLDYPEMKVEDFLGMLDVGPVYSANGSQKVQTNLLQVNYIDIDTEKTKKVLQTLLRVYQNYNLEQQKVRLAKGLEFIDGQLPLVRRSVFEAEAALEQFRRGNNIIDPSEQARSATATLSNIQQQREALKAAIQEASASYANLQQQLALSPQGAIKSSRLSQSSLYQTRLLELQKLDFNLELQRQRLTDDHPLVQDLLRQRQEQVRSLEKEAGNVLGSSNNTDPQQLISNGQLGGNDLSLAQQLTAAQNNLSSLQARDKSLAQTEAQLAQEVKRYPVLIAQYERLQPEVQVRRSTLQRLLDAKQDLSLEIARGGYNWEVVEPPKEGEQISPNIRQNILLGAVLGLFLGAIAAFIRESLDDKVRTQIDLEQQIPIPLLGVVPEISPALKTSALVPLNSHHLPTAPISATPDIFQWQPLRESFDLIYANIQLLPSEVPLKSLAITSPQAGEGKSTIAIGLAISAARLDKRVLLVDADLRQPILHQVFNLRNTEGLSNLLVGDVPAEEVLTVPQWVQMRWEDEMKESIDISVKNDHFGVLPPSDLSIDVLTSGPITADPVKLLNPIRLREILRTFQSKYDLILVDCPPSVGLVDVIQVGMSCDGLALVARLDKVTRSDLAEAIDTLNRFNVIGIIANSVSMNERPYRRSSYL